ncbi:MAG: deoxyribonuclease IV [Mycoplasmatota bacterium]|nr:deoxyribonuclease IV [Mycoplasmatota bacterium]
MKDNELIIGSHVKFTNDEQLLGSVKEALSYNANTFMFYTGAPQNTKRSPINEELTIASYKLMKEHHINPENIIIHAPYIVNLGNLENFDFSVSFLKNEVERAHLLGVKNIVLHPGASVRYSKSESLSSIIKGLNLILDNNYDVTICLETMAGKGTEIGASMEDLKTIIEGIKYQDKIGLCLDTCHLFDSGISLTNFNTYLDNLDKFIGLKYLKCIHINDSKNPIGSHKDRHENIGFGSIGFDTLINIIYNDRLKNIPKILETPYISREENEKEKIYPPYKYEISMIRAKKFDKEMLTKIRTENR